MSVSRETSRAKGWWFRLRPRAVVAALAGLAIAVLATLANPTRSAASTELAGFSRGYGPNAGGTNLLGVKARLGSIEASVIQYEYGGTATSVGWRKPLREKAWLLPSVAMTSRFWMDEAALGPGLSLALSPIAIGKLRIGLRLDNDLLYLVVARQFMPEYLLGLTLIWE